MLESIVTSRNRGRISAMSVRSSSGERTVQRRTQAAIVEMKQL